MFKKITAFTLAEVLEQSAFTLAEVLITLGIIGVVAALTIPALMNQTNDKELIVAWKKAYSSISNGYNQAIMDNGGSIADGGLCPANYMERITELQKYLNVTKICNSNTLGNCWATSGVGPDSAVSDCGGGGVFLRSAGQNTRYSFKTLDGMYYMVWAGCSFLYVDVNGEKGPNLWGKDVHGMGLEQNGKIDNLGACLTSDQNATNYLK